MGGLGMGAMGGTQFGASSMGGGGFTYGSASAAGMVFGAASAAGPIGSQPPAQTTAFGAKSAPAAKGFISNSSNLSGKNPINSSAGFTFGGASQFGAMASGPAFSQPAANDPYANIDIDLTKVKKAEKPSKPFEQRTEEEKAKPDEAKSINQKSNLKMTKEESEAAKSKKEVRFGKSTTY
jgi:hypothetical protein